MLGFDRIKRKFADSRTKLERLCKETGKADKLKNLLESSKDLDPNTIRFVRILHISSLMH
jgi:hypothetical protein